MDIFSLRCFVMLARHLNFTKTANIMNVSQPSLTRIIQNIEDEIGILLIDRSKYRIELTAAGKEFLRNIISTINNYDHAVKCAKEVESMQKDQVRIGFLSYMCAPFIPTVYRNVKELFPDLLLQLVPYRMDDLISALNSKRVDIGLLPDWKFSRYLVDCKKQPFFEDEYYVVLHRNHPYSKKKSIVLSDLSNDTYLFYRSIGDYNTDTEKESIYTMNKDLNMSILTKIKHVSDFVGLFALLDCNAGFSILPSHTRNYCPDSLRFIKIIPSLDKFVGIMCWNTNNKNKYIESVNEIIINTCKGFDMFRKK